MPAESSLTDVPVVVAVGGILAVLAVVILYLNKKWCLYGLSSLNCCDDAWGLRLAPRNRKTDLGVDGYAKGNYLLTFQQSKRSRVRGISCEEAGAGTSSDSEEDGRRRCVKSSCDPGAHGGVQDLAFYGQLMSTHSSSASIQVPPRSSLSGPSGRLVYHYHHDPSQLSQYRYPPVALNPPRYPAWTMANPPPAVSRPARPPSMVIGRLRHPGSDLISLAEKGGVGASSNCSSSSGSTTSEEDKILRHREGRGLHSAQPGPGVNFSPSCTSWAGYPPRPAYRRSEHQVMEVPTPAKSVRDNQDCIVVLSQEDGTASDMQSVRSMAVDQESVLSGTGAGPASPTGSNPPPPLGATTNSCGQLEVAFAYDAPMRNMTIHILQAKDIPAKDRGGPTHTQARVLLLPAKKQKCKSKVRHGDNPQFMESFLLHRINPEDVNSMGVRFRLYGCERIRRERLIGECVVSFSSINLESESNMWLNLEPRANTALKASPCDVLSLARSDSTGSTHSMQHGGVPELLLGLSYNGTTGRLSVEIVKGSHFRNLAMTRAPDTFVRLSLVSSSGHDMSRAKSSVRRGQPNPLFKETFIFQVALFQLPDVTLMVSVYNKRNIKKKEMIGWFSLGLKSSGEEEMAHWNDMCEVRGEQICRWHVLVDS